MLLKAIRVEQYKIACYGYLHPMMPDAKTAAVIKNNLDDEKRHLDAFADLFLRLFGESPDKGDEEPPDITSLLGGVKHLIGVETDTYDLYNHIYSNESNEEVRDIFFISMQEEGTHSVNLNQIYEELNK